MSGIGYRVSSVGIDIRVCLYILFSWAWRRFFHGTLPDRADTQVCPVVPISPTLPLIHPPTPQVLC